MFKMYKKFIKNDLKRMKARGGPYLVPCSEARRAQSPHPRPQWASLKTPRSPCWCRPVWKYSAHNTLRDTDTDNFNDSGGHCSCYNCTETQRQELYIK